MFSLGFPWGNVPNVLPGRPIRLNLGNSILHQDFPIRDDGAVFHDHIIVAGETGKMLSMKAEGMMPDIRRKDLER